MQRTAESLSLRVADSLAITPGRGIARLDPKDLAQLGANIGDVNVLNERAHSLRAQADGLPELLAKTYRRRAAELELEAWAIEVRNGAGEPVAA